MDPNNSSFENSKIEKLKKVLYSRNVGELSTDTRSKIEERNVEVPTSWGAPKSFEYTVDPMSQKKSNSFFNKFLLLSSIVFAICLAVALFIFYGGINMISSNNLEVEVVAPSSITSGEELPIGLSIINGNRTDLEDVTLFIYYPDGSQAINSDKVLNHETVNLGTIVKGGSAEYSLRNVLFGEKDAIKEYSFRIEYKVKGSNATFSKEKTYDVSIGSSPIIVDISYPKEANSGQDVKMVISLTSNAAIVMKNVLVKAEYPYGFKYKNSSIRPLRDNSVWNVGDLKDGDKKTLEVVGSILGQNEEDKTFRFSVGTQSKDNSKDFDADLANEDVTIGIRKSFFDLVVDTTDSSAKKIGEFSSMFIKWQNTLPDKILNTKIEAKLSGNVFDRSRVSVGGGGFYESINDTIFWDKNGDADLTELLPGDSGQVTFTLVSQNDPAFIKQLKNPHIDVHVKISGDRAGEDSSKISSETDFVVKILSTLNLTTKAYRSVGPFTNTGPIPPIADKESTYTITWTITNTTNDLTGALATAKLPVGVIWKGEVSPISEKINYDPDTRTITWNIGNISSWVGFSTSAREVSFKVGIIPSINQITTTPVLVTKTDLTAKDTYVDAPINFSAPQVTTEYSDPSYNVGDSVVKK